jgi:hypothetical protein
MKSSAIVNLENELKHIPITLSWENITVHTPSSRESLTGKLKYLICKKETLPKQIINNGKAKKNISEHSNLILWSFQSEIT